MNFGTSWQSVKQPIFYLLIMCRKFSIHQRALLLIPSFIGVTSVQQCFTPQTPATFLPEGLCPEEN